MSLKKLFVVAFVILASFSINAVEYDFDGDGYADIAIRRASTGVQYILNSTGGNVGSDNGDGIQRHTLGDQETDIPISGDFDGDGIWDVGVRRPSTFEWIIRYSSTGEINTFVFGKDENDIPVPADYDGDGYTDLAVRRPSNQYWYIKNSSGVDERTGNADGITREIFGRQSTDIPVPADYDGDGKADLAVRRASNFTWYIKNSNGSDFNSDNGDGIQRIVFGKNEDDIAVPADYNGDGYADVAVRRPSNYTWYIKNSNGDNYNSSKGDGIQRIVFGRNADDIPVVADYDGDGIADIAVRRASNQMFYIRNSSGNNFNSSNEDGIQRHNFGKRESDTPIAQSLYAIYSDPNRPYYIGESNGVRVDMFSRENLPVMKVSLNLSQYGDGDYAIGSIQLDRPLGTVEWYPEGRFDIETSNETVNVRGTSEVENVYNFDIAGSITGEDGLNMYLSEYDPSLVTVEAKFVKNIVGGELLGERPRVVGMNIGNLTAQEAYSLDFMSPYEDHEDIHNMQFKPVQARSDGSYFVEFKYVGNLTKPLKLAGIVSYGALEGWLEVFLQDGGERHSWSRKEEYAEIQDAFAYTVRSASNGGVEITGDWQLLIFKGAESGVLTNIIDYSVYDDDGNFGH